MVKPTIIIDTGPLVAMTNERDQYHAWARRESVKLKAPFKTCDAVLSEAWFLLRTLPKAREKLLLLLQKGLIHSQFDSLPDIHKLIEMLRRYANVPMSFADACLVRMSELERDCVIFTTDSDFTIYRRNRNETIPLIFPPQP
jgi:predicted nucleic acid-binding protein